MDDLQYRIAEELPYLRRYALAVTRDPDVADDLVQDCLERALAKRHLWLGKGRVRHWLFRVLRNVHINTVKKPERRRMTGLRYGDEADPQLAVPAPQETVIECQNIVAALDSLPSEQRDAIVLIALEGCPYRTAAGILGVPVGTVRSRLSRGRETLRILTGPSPQYGC